MMSIQHRHDRKSPEGLRGLRRLGPQGVGLCTVVFLLVVCAVVAFSWLALAAVGVALADDDLGAQTSPLSESQTGPQKIAAFEDVTIGPGEVWEVVVVVGGDVVVEGTVESVVVVVGGDLTVGSDARIGIDLADDPDATPVVSVFGDLTIEPGSVIYGESVDVAGGVSEALSSVFVDPVVRPWSWGSIVGWIVSTVFIAVVALIATAIAPRQVAFVRDRAWRHFWSSLGWGALAVIIVFPLITVLLIVSVIGLVALVPWLAIGLPVLFLFGYAAIGALIGGFILGKRENVRGPMMLTAVLGVVILCVVRWIPWGGAVVIFLALLLGVGATCTAIWEWRRRKRDRERDAVGSPEAGASRPSS